MPTGQRDGQSGTPDGMSIAIALGGLWIAGVALWFTGSSYQQQGDQFAASMERERIIDCQAAVGRLQDAAQRVVFQLRFISAADKSAIPGYEARLNTTIDSWDELYSAHREVDYQCAQLADGNIKNRPNPPPFTLQSDATLDQYSTSIDQWASTTLEHLESSEADL